MAQVTVREVSDPQDLGRVCQLFGEIWSEDPSDPAVTPTLLRALSYAGGYVSTAEAGGQLLGACVGLLGAAGGSTELHSHIAGVTAAARGRGVGFALKTHQRTWALERGIEQISWTFDPLVRRNAFFNLTRLAARPRAYLENFYGPLTDALNAGDDTDRLVAEWRLRDERVALACAGSAVEPDVDRLLADGASVGLSADGEGRPVVGSLEAATVLVGVPADVERLRVTDPAAAAAWRRGVRHVLGGLLADGAEVDGFARAGWYVVQQVRR